jgi:predicted DNA-binding ribbon-helix-helix protein
MIKQFQELFARLGLKRPGRRRTFPFEDIVFLELVEQAKKEQVPAEELAGEIMSTGLRQRKAGSALKEHWESLSRREKQVTALTCLGYTNRQIGARLYISQDARDQCAEEVQHARETGNANGVERVGFFGVGVRTYFSPWNYQAAMAWGGMKRIPT